MTRKETGLTRGLYILIITSRPSDSETKIRNPSAGGWLDRDGEDRALHCIALLNVLAPIDASSTHL